MDELQAENTKLSEEVKKRSIVSNRVEWSEFESAFSYTASSQRIAEIEHAVSCNICTEKMWSPYMYVFHRSRHPYHESRSPCPNSLYECGHVFCKACLIKWFDEARDKHTRDYPPPAISREMHMHRYSPIVRTTFQSIINTHSRRAGSPKYTCLTCRKDVKSKPVLVYTMRDMVEAVGRAEDEDDDLHISSVCISRTPQKRALRASRWSIVQWP